MEPTESLPGPPGAAHPSDPPPETVIAAGLRPSLLDDLRSVWSRRDLLRAFIARDIKVRYKQTVLGVVWIVLQPVLSAAILAMVRFALGAANASIDPFELVVMFMAGFVPWISFSMAVNTCTNSMVGQAGLIKKIYFPRVIVPLAHVLTPIVDFLACFAFLILIALIGDWVGSSERDFSYFNPQVLIALPGLLALQLTAAAGIGYLTAALNARFRDIRYIVAFVLQIGMFATVFLRLGEWADRGGTWMLRMQAMMNWNPMAAVIETYRLLLERQPIDWALLGRGWLVAGLLFVVGIAYFRRAQEKLVDLL